MNVRSVPGKGEAQAIVILDGYFMHNDIQTYLDAHGLGWIYVIVLPPNVTSHFQPMDQGMISWLKKKYKYSLIRSLLDIYDDLVKMQTVITSRRPGRYDGILQGVKPNVYDAITRVVECWDIISEGSIIKYWKNDQCMSIIDEAAAMGTIVVPAQAPEPLRVDIATALDKLHLSVSTSIDEVVHNEFDGTIVVDKYIY